MGEFRVKSGETHTIKNDSAVMFVDRWIMEDNAKIDFEPDVNRWEITATHTEFHGTSFIDAGRSETSGANGEAAGEHGEDGPDGVDVVMQIGIAVLDTVVIDQSGGKGGDGVRGRKGDTGAAAKCSGKDAKNGGPGRAGGDAGDGGDQGEITVKFWVVEGRQPVVSSAYGKTANTVPGFNFFGEAGKAGTPGGGGPGGNGGAGKDKCGPWPYWKRSGGSPGATGPAGTSGTSGATKLASVVPIPDPG